MSGHTPGPWEVHRFDGGHIDVVKAGTNWLVAGIGTLATEANARLIAAAPELLDMLKRLLSRMEQFPGADAMQSDLESLIAKAEGRES